MTTFLTTIKKTTLGFVLLFLICQIFNTENLNAQTAPPGIPYQAIARNANGTPYVNSSLSVRFSLHEQTSTGTVSYAESHSLQTNDLGLFSTTFGSGTPITGTFAAINWAQTTKFLQVEINLGSAWVDMGTQQLMSVPYAMYAANSGSGTINKGKRIGYGQSGSWICPTGISEITVELWGAGGGGGGGSRADNGGFNCTNCGCLVEVNCISRIGANGGNGGKGGYLKQVISVIPGQSYQITVGAAGIGGSGQNYDGTPVNNGGNGGASIFNNSLLAEGGTGGLSGTSNPGTNCITGSNGQNGVLINFQPQSNFVTSPSYQNISYIPIGYTQTEATISNVAKGGIGGQPGITWEQYATYQCTFPGAGSGGGGGNGEGGFCIISY